MKAFEFLFGSKNQNRKSLGSRIDGGARARLDSKIIKNPLNHWTLVLFRKWFIYPTVKFFLLPLAEALEIRRDLIVFKMAREVVSDAGIATKIRFFPKISKESLRDLKTLRRDLLGIFSALLWMRKTYNPRYKSYKSVIGFALGWEAQLSTKLVYATILSWMASLIFFFYFLVEASRGKFDPAKLFNVLDPKFSFVAILSDNSVNYITFSGCFWAASFVFSLLLAQRPWIKLTQQTKEFLAYVGVYSEDEVETKLRCLAMNELIFLSTPSMNTQRLRTTKAGWPNHFLPGEIIESTTKPNDVIIVRRPEKEPIVFGGAHTGSSIHEHLKAYEKMLEKLKVNTEKSKAGSELILIGEVLDPNWWQSSALMVPLATNPHYYCVGKTRSGKTKTALSLVYSIARAYPDTIWYFADGKDSQDYVPFAKYLSAYPVATTGDESGDPLIQLANIIEEVYAEYKRRKRLFSDGSDATKSASTIYEYREKVGPLPQVFVVIDEFQVFKTEMAFDQNFRKPGTIANRLRSMMAESAGSGIHFLFASQRFQETDMPTVMRSNLSVKFVHTVDDHDASVVGVAAAANGLDSGRYYVDAQGLFCTHTGIKHVKAKLPYIGDDPVKLLEATIPPLPQDKKKRFDPRLDYNRGTNDMEKMSVADITPRLLKFFENQEYVAKELVVDVEASNLQLELRKAHRIEKDKSSVLVAVEDAPAIGVSILRGDEVDIDVLKDLQREYADYPAILIFAVGKLAPGLAKAAATASLNEKGTRFYIVAFREYYKDIKYVEMRRKQGVVEDRIERKLKLLGLTSVSHTEAAKELKIEDITEHTPIKIKMSKIMEWARLERNIKTGMVRGIPYLSTIFPGGAEIVFLLATDKTLVDESAEAAMACIKEDKSVVVISSERVSASVMKQFSGSNILLWKASEVDLLLSRCQSGGEADRPTFIREFVSKMLTDLGHIVSGADGRGKVKIAKTAKIVVECSLSDDGARETVSGLKLRCALTGYDIVHFNPMEIESYRLDQIGIPETARIVVARGFAPAGARAECVTVRLEKGASVEQTKETSQWEIKNYILTRKEYSISEEDPLLEALRD